MKNLIFEALNKKKANDQRGALFALKRKKMLEKEIAKLDGQMTLLETQKLQIIGTIGDYQVFKALDQASTAVEGLNKHINVEKLEDIQEKIAEQNAEAEERRQMFI